MPFKGILKHRCIGCGTCIETCPVDVLRKGPDGKPYAAYPGDCMTCFMCTFDCPVEAIEISLFSLRRTPFGPARDLSRAEG